MDASDFLRGIDGGLIEHEGRGLYKAPRSRASEQFFWSGLKSKNPRPISLWVEPIITIAVLARLHFDLGWPKEALGTQIRTRPGGWAFDVATYLSSSSDSEYIAGEVKKTIAELDRLVSLIMRFVKNPHDDRNMTNAELNAFGKLQALRFHRPPLFWAVGPGGASLAFRIEYPEVGEISFREVAIQELAYPS